MSRRLSLLYFWYTTWLNTRTKKMSKKLKKKKKKKKSKLKGSQQNFHRLKSAEAKYGVTATATKVAEAQPDQNRRSNNTYVPPPHALLSPFCARMADGNQHGGNGNAFPVPYPVTRFSSRWHPAASILGSVECLLLPLDGGT